MARAASLAALVPRLIADGIDELLIESRDAAPDTRDRHVLLDIFEKNGMRSPFAYAWRGKDEPLLWTADAVCGAIREYLVGDERYSTMMREVGVVADPVYINGTGPRIA